MARPILTVAVAAALIAGAIGVGLSGSSTLSAAEKEVAKEDFRTARREISARLRNRDPLERVAAVRELQSYPTVDAVKLLVSNGLQG